MFASTNIFLTYFIDHFLILLLYFKIIHWTIMELIYERLVDGDY